MPQPRLIYNFIGIVGGVCERRAFWVRRRRWSERASGLTGNPNGTWEMFPRLTLVTYAFLGLDYDEMIRSYIHVGGIDIYIQSLAYQSISV